MLVVARRYLADINEAEDAVHDAMLSLLLHTSTQAEEFVPMAIVAVRNRALNMLHSRRLIVPPDERTPDTSPTPEQRMIADENQRQIDAIIAEMPPTQQMVMTLRHDDGLTNSEIARLTGLSETAIRQHLSRGRRRIIEELRNQF